jgi:hypothetical protein
MQKKSVTPVQQRGGQVVDQTIQKKVSATRTTPTAPQVYSPQPKARVLQTKQIPQRGLSTNTVQLAGLSKAEKARLKEKERQKAIARSAEKKVQKTADNLVAYGGVARKEAVAAAKGGVRVPGHHSDDSNSKMNDGTKKALAGFFEARRAAAAAVGGGGGDDEAKPIGGGGGGGYDDDGAAAIDYEELQDGAVKAWNRAVDLGKDGSEAMTAYLAGRVSFDGVPEELANEVRDGLEGFDPTKKIKFD